MLSTVRFFNHGRPLKARFNVRVGSKADSIGMSAFGEKRTFPARLTFRDQSSNRRCSLQDGGRSLGILADANPLG